MRHFSFGTIVMMVAMMVPFIAKAQLAGGTYTINSAVATGGTNYASFGAAVTAMASGITGPVVFNVVAGSGPYTEQVTIGNITGASATNTIKFNGNGATVQYTATTTYQGVLMLNGAKFVKIDSLTFKTVGATNGFGANIYNACNTDTITRCTFDLSSITGTSSTASMGVRIASAATSASTTAVGASNLYFANNKILGTTAANGMYYGLYLYGAGTGNVIEKNTITNWYIYGLYTYYGTARVTGNTLNRETKTGIGYCYGLYFAYAQPGSVCNNNRIYSLGGATASTTYCYPLYIYYAAGSAASPVLVYNNIVYNMTSMPIYGISVYNCTYANVYHNSCISDIPVSYASTMYGLYMYSGNNVNVKNNLVSITAGGTSTKYSIYYSSYTGLPTQRNMTYVNSTQPGTQYYGYLGSAYNTIADFQLANPTQEAGSVSVNPNFVNAATGDLHPTNTAMFAKGVNLQTVVPVDYVGQTRLAAPAAGAFEFQANGTNNAGMVGLVEPLGRYCPGSVPVKATIYNGGTNNITTVKVNWSLNGVPQTPTTYTTTTLTPLTGASPLATITLGNATLAAGVPVAIKIWTSLPNNTTDAVNSNDTLSDTLKAVLLTVDAMKDTVCLNKNAVIALAPGAGYNTGALQWESSTNSGGVWTPIANSDITNYATPNLTGDTWFRVKMTSAPNTCYSDTAKIYTTNPQLLSSTPDTSRCGPGTMTLNAVSSVNSQVKWFDSPNASTPMATGPTFVTPYLGVTDTFYVSAGVPNAQPGDPVNVVEPGVGGYATTSSSNYMPFYGYASSSRQDYIILAEALLAQGFSAGNINSIGLSVLGVGTPNVGTVNISLKMVPQTYTTAATTYMTGMTTAYTGTGVVLQPNSINTFNFQTPFYWDGVSNLVVSFCNSGATSPTNYNYFDCIYNTNFYRTTYGSGSSSMCASTATMSTLYYIPKMYFKMTSACETGKTPIKITVFPVPVVDLGPDINKCTDAGYAEVLDAGVQPYTPEFLWDDNTTSQVRAVNESGSYHVRVKNQFGCSNSDTINVILRANPIVNLGHDTTVCNGVVLNLNPGNNGIEYFWNTGQTSQNINISSPGTYSVFVTNSQGCTKADTIVVSMQGELPTIQGINVTNNGQYTFHFTAVNPENVIGYDWDFGDGTPHSYQASPYHTYADAGNYIVVLHLSSSCGFFSDSSSAHILGINQLNVGKDEMTVYPNPSRETATILNRGALKMESVAVYNVFGQVIYKAKADSKDKHSLNLGGFASGIYTIQIFTDKGTVARKLEVIK